MDALLILSGIVLLLLGWIWLVVASVRLPLGKVLFALFLPLLTLLRRDQGYSRLPRLVLAAGLLTGLLGLGMLFHLHPHRFERLMSGQWQEQPPARSAAMTGEIMGQQFRPDRVFWRADDLILEEGPPETARGPQLAAGDLEAQGVTARLLQFGDGRGLRLLRGQVAHGVTSRGVASATGPGASTTTRSPALMPDRILSTYIVWSSGSS